MDIFVEQIVKKRLGTQDFLIFVGIIIAGVVIILGSLMIPILAGFSFIILIAICFGAYFLIVSRNLEFEYSITNGDITVDKIINRSKRKRIVSFDTHLVEEMGKYEAEKHQGKSYEKRLFVGESANGKDAWYMTFRTPELGNTLLVFNPNEKVLTAIKPFLPRQVARDAFGRC